MSSGPGREMVNEAVDALEMAGPINIVLRPSRRKWILILVFCLIFIGIGCGMVRDPSSATDTVMGIFCAVVFAFGAIVAVAQMSGTSELKIGPEGFTVVNFGRKGHYQWDEVVDGFGVGKISRTRMVMFSLKRPRTKNVAFSEALTGFGYGLPDTYGMKAEALAALMTGCWMRATQGF